MIKSYQEPFIWYVDAWTWDDKLIVHNISKYHKIVEYYTPGLNATCDGKSVIYTSYMSSYNKRITVNVGLQNNYGQTKFLKLLVLCKEDKFVILEKIHNHSLRWVVS